MAKGAPKRNLGGGGKTSGKPGVVAGYGLKGKAFSDPAKYKASKSGQEHAKNPALSTKPVGTGAKGNVFFNQNKANQSKSGQMSGAGAPPGGYHPAGATTPMPGHPSANPTHYHGPATVGKISGPRAPGGMK